MWFRFPWKFSMLLVIPILTGLLSWAGLVGCAPGLGQETRPSGEEAVVPSTAPDEGLVEAEKAENPEAEVLVLLDSLERSADDLTGFTAQLHFEDWDELLGRRIIRLGEMIYVHAGKGEDKKFAILFSSQIVNRRKETRLRHYIFDGRWLAEIDHENKQFINREIVAPGESFDPLKLGEGPFPVPIGQSRVEVMKRFLVSRIPLPEEGSLGKLRGKYAVDGLRMVPREGTPEAKEYARIDLFFDRATRLPVGIEVIELNGDRKTVRFSEMKRNPELGDEERAKLDITEPDDPKWRKDIRAWGGG